ncbi:hypothetical protein ACFY05_42125 [Microtetraspora fusca]|uniref:Uncharacterized protein n=1 Tax=Microtetraspora fusca TaxID=1997 RepID=A0ABW6VJ90_MICFU
MTSPLQQLAEVWPLGTHVRHVQTGRTGTVALCPARDPMAADLLNGGRAGHAHMRTGEPIVFVDFGDPFPAWYRPTVLRRTTASGTRTVWRGKSKRNT